MPRKTTTAYSRVQSAIKAVKQGHKGSTTRLKKAIKSYAAKTCKIKSVKNTGRKLVRAGVGKRKKSKR